MKASSNLERLIYNNETIIKLIALYEQKGREFYYNGLFSRDQAAIIKKTNIEDIFHIKKYLNLEITESRMKLWTKKELVPKNKDEQKLSNLIEILKLIKNGAVNFELLTNEITDLAKLVTKNITKISYKEDPLLSKKKTKRDYFEELITLYKKNINSKQYELIQIITNFYVDFLNMEIFDTDNDLIALLLLHLLISKHFAVFKYVSFFKILAQKKEVMKHALIQAKYYWNEGYSQTDSLAHLIITIISSAYEELSRFAHEYEFERGLNKSDTVENTIMKLSDIFKKEDIKKMQPTISVITIDRTLLRLKEDGKIIPLGKGRSSRWQKISEEKKEKKFFQTSLFD